jgi:hypothetical protein
MKAEFDSIENVLLLFKVLNSNNLSSRVILHNRTFLANHIKPDFVGISDDFYKTLSIFTEQLATNFHYTKRGSDLGKILPSMSFSFFFLFRYRTPSPSICLFESASEPPGGCAIQLLRFKGAGLISSQG